jgi:NAD(P)-dependent dehydrogenase (short-subunit alcohol dehydrogenase family)
VGKLDNKVAVITGATSGMALAAAKLFVEEGAFVFITGRRRDVLDRAVEMLGGNVIGVQGDAADLTDLDRLFATVEAEKGRLDVLYASAGKGPVAVLGDVTEEQFDSTFGVNTRGTLFTVQKALPLFNDGGSIILTGSNSSIKGIPGYSVYAASKAALHAFARVWLNELKDRRIRVNVVSPGPIETDFINYLMANPETRAMVEGSIPRGTVGRPEEVATIALFLACDDSSFVNGQWLNVDGGASAV